MPPVFVPFYLPKPFSHFPASEMSVLVPKTSRRLLMPKTIRSASKQSSKCHVISVRLRSAIDKFLEEQEMKHMKKKVLRLYESFAEIKDVNRLLPFFISKELVEDPLKSMEQSKRWKIKSGYGDIGLTYADNWSFSTRLLPDN